MGAMKKGLIMLMALGLIATGCAGTKKAKKEPVTADTLSSAEALAQQQISGAGLWRGGRKIWLFRDLRAREVGDVVTVNVDLTTCHFQRGSDFVNCACAFGVVCINSAKCYSRRGLFYQLTESIP